MKYVGRGESIPGIPARDLTDQEVQIFGEERLILSGLYVVVESEVKLSRVRREDKAIKPDYEEKQREEDQDGYRS